MLQKPKKQGQLMEWGIKSNAGEKEACFDFYARKERRKAMRALEAFAWRGEKYLQRRRAFLLLFLVSVPFLA